VAGTVKLEKMVKPGVFITCDTFADDAKSASHDNGMPGVRRSVIKSSEFYKLRGDVKTIRPLVEAVFDDLIKAITTPLTKEEANPPPGKKEEDGPAEITVTAESFLAAIEEMNQQFVEKRWGDGLPLIPPTPERVKWMLSGTSRPPQEIIGKVNPKQGVATIEKIAINAVMAGARPEYLPVIIAAMEALTDEYFDDLHILVSAGSFSLIMVVSGPIAKELNMNAGIGFLGHGWRSNNTIGRAVRLATLNIGKMWPGVNDMGLTGRVNPHTFYTFAENADLSPWEPYPANRGFKATDSCVTVATIGGASPMQNFYGGMIGTWTASGILDNIVADIIRTDRGLFGLWGVKGVGQYPGSGVGARSHFIILFPELAAEFKKMGYDQKSLQDEIYKRAAVRYEELSPADKKGIQTGMETGVVPAERKAVFEVALKPGGMVPVLITPENIHLFVAGGAPGCAFSFSYFRLPPYNHIAVMTRLVTGATLTKVGATEAKNVPYGA
jgi:hypothetical protein